MKFISNKAIFLILFIVVFAAFSFSSYYTYMLYGDYKRSQNDTKQVIFLTKVDTLVDVLAKEVYGSATYLGMKKKDAQKMLEQERETVSSEIKKLNAWIENNAEFDSYKSNLQEISKNLGYIRSKVDTFSKDYNNLFFDEYENNVFQQIIVLLKNVAKKQTKSQEGASLKQFITLEKLKYHLALEKAYLVYTVDHSTIMQEKDLIAWDKLQGGAMPLS